MKKLIFSFVFALVSLSLFAQSTPVRRQPGQSEVMMEQPLIIVDSIESDFYNMKIKPERIESIDVLKDSASVASYGEKAKYGVVIIRIKKGTEAVRYPALLSQYNIPEQNHKLKLAIDNILVKDANKLVIDRNDIQKVEVITDVLWSDAQHAGPVEKYINIEMKKDKIIKK
jgi:TonB-dependent SusC/RagA subfamily outer membrane receptor